MADQDAINVVRENIEAFSASDMQRFGATLADDSIYQEFSTQRRAQGRDDVVRLTQGWKQAFPDARGTITSIFSSGDQVALEVTWEGTHQGELVGPQGTIPASGKSVRVQASQVCTVEGGKVKETHHYFDIMTLLQQIGAV